jgi:hypothetical protein
MTTLNILFVYTLLLINHDQNLNAITVFKNQNQEVIYSLNEYATTNIVKQGQEVPWGPTKRVQSSYIIIRQKSDGTTYLQVTIGGQFAYGGYFKYLGKEGSDFKYIRTDETSKVDYLFINFPLTVLSESQKYDESIVMKMINYQTSYGMFFKF